MNEHDAKWFERVLEADRHKGIDLEVLKAQITELATWYDQTPSTVNLETIAMWKDYARVGYQKARNLAACYGVDTRFVEGQPYETPEAMCADIDNGRLLISVDNNAHPILTPFENLTIRVWHDLTHYKIRSNFGFLGEVETARVQASQCGNDTYLTHVLHCDIVGQVAWGLIHREFPTQKVFTLAQSFLTYVGKENRTMVRTMS